MLSSEAFDGVLTIDGGTHALAFLQGTNPAVVRVSQRLVLPHVNSLEACIDLDGAEFEFLVRASLASRGSRALLRGHATSPSGDRITIGAQARDENERSFDVLGGTGRAMTVVGSLRLGQRVMVEGDRAPRREPWPFPMPQAAA